MNESIIYGKVCSDCKQRKPLDQFHRNSNSKDGYKFRCKPCTSVYNRAHLSDAEIEHRRQTAIEWQKKNREHIRDDPRYKASRSRSRIRSYNKNPEGEMQRTREWARRNPAQAAAISHKRRVIARNAGSFTQAEWDNVVDLYGKQCLRCGATERLTIDHVIPLSKGGANIADNLQPLCHSCNSSKGSKIIDFRKSKK
jgi:5-methylcytosine-specific restriction endonuclease McrA